MIGPNLAWAAPEGRNVVGYEGLPVSDQRGQVGGAVFSWQIDASAGTKRI